MVALLRQYRLSARTNVGLSCSRAGVFLAGVPLLRQTEMGFAPRRTDELDALMKAAYGGELAAGALTPGLNAVANALNRDDIALAMTAAVHLRLSDVSAEGAARILLIEDALAKYDPDQPRDWRGRWTTGAGGPAGDAPSAQSSGHANDGAPGRLSPPSGGYFIPVQDEPLDPRDNGPPLEPPAGPIVEPQINAPRVPEGWDVVEDGRVVRRPTLRNGQSWPVPTPEIVRAALMPQRGQTPVMVLFVPTDGKGPMLVGSDAEGDFMQPPGYQTVRLFGTPQVTYSRGAETGHAEDSIEEALRLGATNQFSELHFNRTFSTATGRVVQSLIRPDVLAVVRPELDLEDIYHPYESYSPGQNDRTRLPDMPNVPWVRPVYGRRYKAWGVIGSPYFRYIGLTSACS